MDVNPTGKAYKLTPEGRELAAAVPSLIPFLDALYRGQEVASVSETQVMLQRSMIIDLSKFSDRHLSLFRAYGKIGRDTYLDLIKWDEEGVLVSRKREGAFRTKTILGPFRFTWEELQDSVSRQEDISAWKYGDSEFQHNVKLSKSDAGKLLRLKGFQPKGLGGLYAVMSMLRE